MTEILQLNILHERDQFYCRSQRDQEAFEDFVESVRQLATTCHFYGFEESLIRDRVVFGMADKHISMQIIESNCNPSLSEVIDIHAALSPRLIANDRDLADTPVMSGMR